MAVNGSENIIHLNVGGKKLTTSRSTLMRYPDSMLARMLNSRLKTSTDNEGQYFIDGNGDMFLHILDFLRRNKLILPQGFNNHELLLAEAEFYQIQPLVERLKRVTDSKTVTMNVGGVIYTLSLEIIGKYPESYIASLVNGRIKATYDQQGRYFIDGDGELFRHIVNYLRHDELLLPDDFQEYDLLLMVADFYRLDCMSQSIRLISRKHIDVVTINVGGFVYHTTLKTLQKQRHSRLNSMLNVVDDKGRHCIEGDGEMFRYVLEFLRKDSLNLPRDFEQYDLLIKQADFYDVQPLVKYVREIVRRNIEKTVG